MEYLARSTQRGVLSADDSDERDLPEGGLLQNDGLSRDIKKRQTVNFAFVIRNFVACGFDVGVPLTDRALTGKS